jgi:hypothetical protein
VWRLLISWNQLFQVFVLTQKWPYAVVKSLVAQRSPAGGGGGIDGWRIVDSSSSHFSSVFHGVIDACGIVGSIYLTQGGQSHYVYFWMSDMCAHGTHCKLT